MTEWLPPMLRDAYPFLLILLLFVILSIFAGIFVAPAFYIIAAVLIGLGLFIAYFFRNPDRHPPSDSGLVLSPADGHVSFVKKLDLSNPESEHVVSIFLSVFDVHINRAPIAGKITAINYKKGKFLNALNQQSSLENEQNIVTVENGKIKIVFTQIAGVIARRIVFWKKIGDTLEAGERVGLIKFGSRTDLILPSNIEICVKKGDRVIGGITIIGKLKNDQ